MKPIQFHIFRGTLTLRLIPTIITLLMLPVLLGLGFWQIQRLHWKNDLIAEIHERMNERMIDIGLSTILPETLPDMDYHPARATGTFQNDKALYLNSTSVGSSRGGYDILVPLTLEDGRVLLVNRGWIPYALKDNPDSEHGLYRPTKPVDVTGLLRLPAERPPMRPNNQPGKNDWYWIDLPAMTQATGIKEMQPFILEADDAPHDGAYPVGGQTRIQLVNHHFQYALTWFWLAFILPVIYLISSWKKDVAAKPEVAEQTEQKEP